MLQLDYTAIYTWAKRQEEPFTPYRFEQTFNLGRNSSVPYLESPAFERVPIIQSRRYYKLSPNVDSLEAFKQLIRQRPVARVTRPLGLVTTAFGNKDLSANTIITAYRKAFFDISDNVDVLTDLAVVAKNIGKLGVHEADDETLATFVDVMARAYPVVVKASALLHQIFEDPRIADTATVRSAIEGRQKDG